MPNGGRKAAKEAEEFLLRTKGISIKQKEVPEGVDPKTILCEYFRYGCCAKTAEKCKFSHDLNIGQKTREGNSGTAKRNIYDDDEADAHAKGRAQGGDRRHARVVVRRRGGSRARAARRAVFGDDRGARPDGRVRLAARDGGAPPCVQVEV